MNSKKKARIAWKGLAQEIVNIDRSRQAAWGAVRRDNRGAGCVEGADGGEMMRQCQYGLMVCRWRIDEQLMELLR